LNNVGPAELSHSGAGRLHSFDGKGTERRAAAASGSAPDAWLEIEPQFAEALLGRDVGHELIVITWMHEARRDVLKNHPRGD